MADNVVPMIHVPDVRATVDWYEEIGFTATDTYDNGGSGLSFAVMSFGSSKVMFNEGGRPSTRKRREVDLYVYTEHVDELYRRLMDRVEVVERPHDTFYGMRELIIRDLNRFWITFGQESAFQMLMTGVREGNSESVRAALDSGGMSPEMLTDAFAAASAGDRGTAEIVLLLEKAGAMPPPVVDAGILQSYVGTYRNEGGLEVGVTLKEGNLFVALAGQQPQSVIPIDKTTFRPVSFDLMTVTFKVEASKTTGVAIVQGPNTVHLKRIE
jgi:uncharacterized glyoxalase superfamily protein PhnB